MFVPRSKPYVSFIGKKNGTHGVVITWNSKSSDLGSNGQELGTVGSATVAVESDYFCANKVTFEVRISYLIIPFFFAKLIDGYTAKRK